MEDKKILFIGAGKMGSAIIKYLLKKNLKTNNIKIVKPSNNNKINNLEYFNSFSELQKKFKADIIFFAFKPQNTNEILTEFNKTNIYNQNSIFISMLAGKKIHFFENHLGHQAKIIRIMPNLPILNNEGLTTYCTNRNIPLDQAKEILQFLGQSIHLENENMIDATTPISGSGPALLFLFTKNLVKIAQKMGLNESDAIIMAKQTIYGSAKMMIESKENLNQLIQNVTSKDGVTASCLEVLENKENSLVGILEKAIDEGKKKAERL